MENPKPEWHAPVIVIIDIERTLMFCGSGGDFLDGEN
jgi:hypothetical protein